MGFFSFLGRVLFASIFILSAWQMFNEFGEDGGPAAKEWAPKLDLVKKHIDGLIGKNNLHIDVRTFVAACIFLKGLGGLLFVLGSSFGAYLLIYYLILTTPLLYDFYNYKVGQPKFFGLLQEFLQDYLKTVVPSQLLAERGSNLVVINPGSANVRIGLAQQDAPISVPHCIARRTSQVPKKNVQDQLLNSQVTTAQHMERERAYDIVLQSRTNPTAVSWKGGAILGILDFTRDAWIHREDWIRNGIHIGSGRKYKDSYFLQAQTMCYLNN
ncbi:UNVERIFIED_CONTAM: Actin-related protein 9 [Sesamum radiatum]|uniref:Actin-related protein 9 n=1 Tax=Sesamum radiatum TaxID=300843 RepID=A0AAW2S7D5_SESRA